MSKRRDPRYDTARWRRLHDRIVARDGHRCTTLGCRVDVSRPRALHVDHVVEVEDGGDFWDPGNLRALCWVCHGGKTRLATALRGVGGGGRRPGFLTDAEYAALRPSRDW